jgi:flavin-dependent dehydrogenase
VRAAWLAAADGLHSPTRRRLGLDRPSRGAARFGLRRHVRVAPWSDDVEVHWAQDAECYVTPVADDLVGVAVLTAHRGSSWTQWMARFPAVAARVAQAEAGSDDRGAGPLRQRATRLVHGRVLLVGDAAGYVDALTGEGLAAGFAQADELVRAVAEGRPETYEAAARRVTRRSRGLTAGLLAATSQPWLRARLVPAAARAPRVFGEVVDLLA